jgi:uncharacterized membrane protein
MFLFEGLNVQRVIFNIVYFYIFGQSLKLAQNLHTHNTIVNS